MELVPYKYKSICTLGSLRTRWNVMSCATDSNFSLRLHMEEGTRQLYGVSTERVLGATHNSRALKISVPNTHFYLGAYRFKQLILEEQIHSDIPHTPIRYDFQILCFHSLDCLSFWVPFVAHKYFVLIKLNVFPSGYLCIKCNIKKLTHGH